MCKYLVGIISLIYCLINVLICRFCLLASRIHMSFTMYIFIVVVNCCMCNMIIGSDVSSSTKLRSG